MNINFYAGNRYLGTWKDVPPEQYEAIEDFINYVQQDDLLTIIKKWWRKRNEAHTQNRD